MKKTFYEYEPLGRISRFVRPDGFVTTLNYVGEREVKRTQAVGGNNQLVTYIEERDGLGRLAKVTEPAGGVVATYSYEVGGRLRQAVLQTGTPPQEQVRSWSYDGLGLLRSETLPELGGQAVTYEAYDPLGNLLRVHDPRVGRSLSYDKAGRLVKVEELGANGSPMRTLREFGYASANGAGDFRKGKLWWQRAWNFWDDGTVVEVRQDYVYGGLMGAVSEERVTVSSNQGPYPSLAATFSQQYVYGAESGQVEVHRYPLLAGVRALPRRQVDYRYDQGMLVRVLPYYALGIRYNPNFLPYEIQRPQRLAEEVACGFSQILELDSSNFMARPKRLHTAGVIGSGGEV